MAFVCVQLIVPLFNLYITGLPRVSLRQQLSTVALYIALELQDLLTQKLEYAHICHFKLLYSCGLFNGKFFMKYILEELPMFMSRSSSQISGLY
jgi:hypothetical protein